MAHGLVVLVNPTRAKGIGFHEFRPDELGAGHPARVRIRLVEPQKILFVHGFHAVGSLSGTVKVRGKFRAFQHLAHADARTAFFRRPQKEFQHIRVYPVVAVHKAQPLPCRLFQRQIPGGGLTGVLLVKANHPAVLGGVVVAELAAVIRASIVHQNQLKVRKRLRQNAAYAVGKVVFCPINRDNHRDFRHIPSLLSPLFQPPPIKTEQPHPHRVKASEHVVVNPEGQHLLLPAFPDETADVFFHFPKDGL